MSTIEDYKKLWEQSNGGPSAAAAFDHATMRNIVKSRTRKHINVAMKYFWASFTLQILVYSLLAHVIIRYGSETQTLVPGVAGIVLFIPFTIMLMRKFKAMAVTRLEDGSPATSIRRFVERQHALLQGFYRFKKRYEILLIPLSTAIGTFLIFKLYVPGGVMAYWTTALFIFVIAIVSCAAAISSENKKRFKRPLDELQKIMEEFKVE